MAAKTHVRVTGIKVDPDYLSDLRDMAACSTHTALTGRCPGGRIIVSGHMCTHCGKDPSDDGMVCPEPKDKRVQGMIRAAVAKKVIRTAPKPK